MSRTVWSLALAALVLAAGLGLGVGAIFFLPIAGALAMLALIFWFGKRRAEGRPPPG